MRRLYVGWAEMVAVLATVALLMLSVGAIPTGPFASGPTAAAPRSAPLSPAPTASAPLVLSVHPAGSRAAAANLTWRDLNLSYAPPISESGGMVYDTTDGYAVMFGGRYLSYYGFVYYNSTWTFSNGSWKNITTAVHPSGRLGFLLADDPADHAVVLYGGQGRAPGLLNDTWEFRAGVWTNVTTGVAPPGRFWGGMSYDSSLNEVLLFGGQQGLYPPSKEYSNDTWAFHAGNWTQLSPATSPPGRDGVQMADDIADHEVVAFGGLNSSNDLNDTWTYANGTWTQSIGATAPDIRTGVGIAYDAAIQDVVMYGGYPANSYYFSTWLFHAGIWTRYATTPTPPAGTIWNQMTYDPADQAVLLLEDDGVGNQTWELSASSSSPLSVQASATPLVGTAPLNVTFAASASGGTAPYTYNWTFGDGALNSSPGTFHVYSAAGSYDSVLNVTDHAGAKFSDGWTIQVNPSVGPPLSLVASATPLTGATPLVVAFNSTPTGGDPPYHFLWRFGDGVTGAVENTTHTYPTAGSYDANLTVTDSLGATKWANWTVVPTTVTGSPLAIVASASPLTGIAPFVVSFTASASGGTAPYSYSWTFGDGTTGVNGVSSSTTHTYTTAGVFVASLTVTDHAGASKGDTWTITSIAPLSVSIAASPTSSSIEQVVEFSSVPTGGVGPYTFAWEFGDGGTASTQNASHSYATPGSFVANLSVHDARGSEAMASVTLTVVPPNNGPASATSNGSTGWILLVVLVVVAALVLVIYLQRRRRKPADTAGPTPGPESPPGGSPR